MCNPNYDYSDSEPNASQHDYESDIETDRLERIEKLRNENKKIPRKLRTHNLLLTDDFCDHWSRVEGIRELVQNFLDGVCTAFDTTMDYVKFQHKTKGGPKNSIWTEEWIAVSKVREDKEFGRITHNLKTDALIITNENVTQSERVLLYGKSNKRKRRHLIGGYGEGMKIGILRLVVEGLALRYRTGGQIWKFFMKKPRGAEDKTLHYRTADSRPTQRQRGNLEVLIKNVDADDFVVENFLHLSRHLQFPVHESEQTPGNLIESPSRHDLASTRVYVKGLYVHSNPTLRVSVNFTDAEVTRDRNIRLVDSSFLEELASIWAHVLENEEDLPMGDQTFTKKFLSFAQNDTSSVEFRCMDHMDDGAAKCLYNFILKHTPNAFPYKRGAEEEAKLISQSLKKKPYPVQEKLLKLLMKRPEVMTVYEAQETAFLSNSAASSSLVYELPLARMVMAYILKVVGADKITVKFHKPATTEIDALLKDGVLICSEDLVQVDYEDEEQAVAAKLDIITSVERELHKGNDAANRDDSSLQTMRFVASAEFRTYLCPPTRSPSDFPLTPESTEDYEDDSQLNPEDAGEGCTLVGSKRPFAGEENSEPDVEDPASITGTPRSRTKRTKLSFGPPTATEEGRSELPTTDRRPVRLRKTSQSEVNGNGIREDSMKTSDHDPSSPPQAQATPPGEETPVVTPNGRNRNEKEGTRASRSDAHVNNAIERGPDEMAGRRTPSIPASHATTPRQMTTATVRDQDENEESATKQLHQNREANREQAPLTTAATHGSPAMLETALTSRGDDQDEAPRRRPAETTQGLRGTTLPHRMRFVLGESTIDLTHKLSSPTEFAIVQSFEDSDSQGGQVTTMNLGTIFPACRTKDGDVLVSVRVQEKICESNITRRAQRHIGGHGDIDPESGEP